MQEVENWIAIFICIHSTHTKKFSILKENILIFLFNKDIYIYVTKYIFFVLNQFYKNIHVNGYFQNNYKYKE